MSGTILKILGISIIYTLFFILLSNETLLIGGIKLGVLWKIPLLLYLIFYVVSHSYGKRDVTFLIVSFLYVAKLILNVSFPKYFFQDASSAITELFLPLSYYYFTYRYGRKPTKVLNFVIYLSVFYLLSSLPFILGIINTVGKSSNFEHWGGSYDINLLNGIFFDVQLASKVFVFSTIVILSNYKWFSRSLISRWFYYALLLLGSYSVYKAFTRTGWISLVLGILVYYLYRTNYKQKTKFILTGSAFVIIFLIQSDSIDIVKNRIFGIHDIQKKNYSQVDELTSSRTILYGIALNTIKNADFKTLMIGYGEEQGRIEFTRYINKAMVAHNRFLEILISGGLIALLLFILMVTIMAKKIRKDDKKLMSSNINKTAFILLLLYIFYLFPSHGTPLWADIIMGGYIFLKEARLQNRILD